MGEQEAADLRDERVVRATFFHQLMDWEGTDLKSVYEPISQQIGYIFTFFLIIMCTYVAWKKYRRWRTEAKEKLIAYKVLKPPSRLAAEGEGGKQKKRICAVVGGTGFIGSEVVNELVRRDEYFVYVLGRTFRPERTNPDADCLIQVDLRDSEGLAKAFQGVDSVINAAAFVPTVFTKADDVRRLNKTSLENVLRAAKEAGVKNLVHVSGIPIADRLKDPVMRAFWVTLVEFEEVVKKANGKNGLSTCVVGPPNVVGLNSLFFKSLISGKLTEMPMADKMPISFVPVEYVARALVNAEAKLAQGDQRIAGRFLPLCGERMSWKALFQLPTWPHKIKPSSKWMLNMIIKINTFFANVFGWAPFGPDVNAAIMEMLDVTESEEVTSEQFSETCDLLGVGPPTPKMEEYITEMVKRYKATQETAKDK